MTRRVLKANFLLWVTAIIWGMAFVGQRAGMQSLGPFFFNFLRFCLGAWVLLPLFFYCRRGRFQNSESADKKIVPLSGYLVPCSLAGSLLFLGAACQQVGIIYTTAGKAGFITGLYVVFVAVIEFLLGRKNHLGIWVGMSLATIGMYFLSINEEFSFAWGDLLELIGAVFWALHVILVGEYAARLDPLGFSIGQFFVCSVFNLIIASTIEETTFVGVMGAIGPILFCGVISVGIAYTLQVFAQRDALPAHAAVILSTESVFAALTGYLFLNETMSNRALLGCCLLMTGVLVTQLWPDISKKISTDSRGFRSAKTHLP